MKQLLLFLCIVCLALAGRAQTPTPRLRFSEFYISPNVNKSTFEYFELGNYSGVPESTDDYLVITYFERDLGGNKGVVKGFYLIDLPNITVAPGGVLVASAGGVSSLNAKYNWNDTTNPSVTHAAFKKFLLNGNGNVVSLDSSGIVTADRNDIFVTAQNNNLMMLFKKKNSTFKLMDGLIAGSNNPVIPNYVVNIQTVLSFYFTGVSGVPERMELDFSEYKDKTIENLVTPASGSDNGYAFCSSWKKSAAPTSFSPGVMNIYASGSSATSSPELTPVADIALDSLAFILQGGAPGNYPVTVSLYKDIGATAGDTVSDKDFSGTVDQLLATKTVSSASSLPVNIYPTPPASTTYWLVITGGECTRKLPYFFDVAFEQLVLPVTLSQFQGVRAGNQVELSWQTASESNNKGFYVQRKSGGSWTNISFVASKAPDGTTTQALSYTATDDNPAAGNSQYRLLQEDRDGKTSYSAVISVEGTGHASGVRVLANPSTSGRVQIVLEGATILRNVLVSDMSGRILKSYRSVRSGSLQVDGLQAGLYLIRIQNIQTGNQVTEKVLVTP